jgi:hypothetical protein
MNETSAGIKGAEASESTKPKSDIAHHVNTPLQVLLSNTEYLRGRVASMFRIIDCLKEMLDPCTSELCRDARFAIASRLLDEACYEQLEGEIHELFNDLFAAIEGVAAAVKHT